MKDSPWPISIPSRSTPRNPLRRHRRGRAMPSKRLAWSFGLVLMAIAQAASALLPIQSWQTSRGARVLFVENHDLPMLDVSVDFPAGSGFDSSEKSGVASMTNNMLRLGAGGL